LGLPGEEGNPFERVPLEGGGLVNGMGLIKGPPSGKGFYEITQI